MILQFARIKLKAAVFVYRLGNKPPPPESAGINTANHELRAPHFCACEPLGSRPARCWVPVTAPPGLHLPAFFYSKGSKWHPLSTKYCFLSDSLVDVLCPVTLIKPLYGHRGSITERSQWPFQSFSYLHMFFFFIVIHLSWFKCLVIA